jgi:pantothenate kinase
LTATAARRAVALARSAGDRVILGLVGPPGAGKSTLARAIVSYACDEMGEAWAACLPLDGFHLSKAQLQRLGRENRKGAPDTFDVDGYVALLSRVAADSGNDVYVPDYDRTVHEPIAARLVIPRQTQLIVTDGNYLALDAPGWREARKFIDHLWYVDAADDLRQERLVARQISGGRSEQAAWAWVESNDRPNGEVVKASKANCDRTVTPAR